MAMEVLRPQDLLVERCRMQPKSFNGRRNSPANFVANRKQHRKDFPKPDKRKIKVAPETNISSHGGGIVTGQVRLLRRGEPLSSVVSKIASVTHEPPIREPVDDLPVSGTERTEPDSLATVPKQICKIPAPPADFYAGSACCLSPSPRALPLPSFFNKDIRRTRVCSNSIEN